MRPKNGSPNVGNEGRRCARGGMVDYFRRRVKLEDSGVDVDLGLGFGASRVRMFGEGRDGETDVARGANDAGRVG